MRALMTIDCQDGSDIMVEVTPDREVIFHGYDHEAKLAEIALGFTTQNDPCLVAYVLFQKILEGSLPPEEVLHRAIDKQAAWTAHFFPPVEIIDVLLALGADPNKKNFYDDHTSLSLAVHYGKLNAAKKLLEAGADPNLPTGHPPLLDAAERGFHKAIPLLALYGADIEGDGVEALGRAISRNHKKVVQALVDLDVNVNAGEAGDEEYGELLSDAVAHSADDPTIVSILLDAGADISANNYEALELSIEYDFRNVEKVLRLHPLFRLRKK